MSEINFKPFSMISSSELHFTYHRLQTLTYLVSSKVATTITFKNLYLLDRSTQAHSLCVQFGSSFAHLLTYLFRNPKELTHRNFSLQLLISLATLGILRFWKSSSKSKRSNCWWRDKIRNLVIVGWVSNATKLQSIFWCCNKFVKAEPVSS